MDTAKLVAFSHLSDAQEMINGMCASEARERINFVKYVILQTKGDLNTLIDPNKMWADFMVLSAYGN